MKEPLVHFLLAGLCVLFATRYWMDAPGSESRARESARTIRVPAESLRAFVQSRTQITDPAEFEAAYEQLSAEDVQRWQQRFVREEALVREARRLGLDQGDEIIRRRLVQKVEFLTVGRLESELRPTDEEIGAFYEAHRDDYLRPAVLSFSHVFVRPGPEAHEKLEALILELRRNGVSARDSLGRGDRFLYNRNYVDRTADEVVSHFGPEMAKALLGMKIAADLWQGPLESEHGLHAVLLSAREPAGLPGLEEIRTRVTEDWRRQAREASVDRALQAIVDGYQVETLP